MAAYVISSDIAVTGANGFSIHDGDTVTVDPGITVESDKPTGGYIGALRSPIRSDGGNNTLINHGMLGGGYNKGYTVFFSEGGDHLINASDGTIITKNACLEIQDVADSATAGNNYVENDGFMKTNGIGICIGPNSLSDNSHDSHGGFPGYFGGNTIVNAAGATIISTQVNCVRVDGGGNLITNDGEMHNTGSAGREAVWFSSLSFNTGNTLNNSGDITSDSGAAINSGDAHLAVVNTGTITGDIQFGANGGSYDGSGGGILHGAICSGAGNDTMTGYHETNLFRGGDGLDILCGRGCNDTLIGGYGSDTLTGGMGADTFTFTSKLASPSSAIDTITDFTAGVDHLNFSTAITSVDTIGTGALSQATMDSDIANATALPANHAVVFTPDSGDLAGKTFLIVDYNGTPGYQAGVDFVVNITGYAGTITKGDFI